METVKKRMRQLGLPRIIIIAFIILIFIGAFLQGQDMKQLVSDSLVRFGMNLIFALAMMPAILSGIGLNMGLAIGIVCGLFGGLVSIEMGLTSWVGIACASLIALVIGSVVGVLYGRILNGVKGSEMLIGNYLGYAVVYLLCMFWFIAPFKNPAIIWPMGGDGVRSTVTLSGYYEHVLNDFLSFQIGGVTIPTGLFLFVFGICWIIRIFCKSKVGVTLQAAGNNPEYANSSGIHVNRCRIIGALLSTALGALGIVVYAQSYGFYSMYEAPLTMSFTPMAAVLLGGATMKKVSVWHAIVGTLLFQTMLTAALPVANMLLPDGNLSEVFRIIVSNGIILYALSQAGGES